MVVTGEAGTVAGRVRWKSSFRDAAFTCKACGICCAVYRIQVDDDDIARMSLADDQVAECVGDSIIARTPEGMCIFNRDNLCKRYEVRPISCRTYPLDVIFLGKGRAVVDVVYTCPYVGIGESYTPDRINATMAEDVRLKPDFYAAIDESYDRTRAGIVDAFERGWPGPGTLEAVDAALITWAVKHEDPVSALFAGTFAVSRRFPPVPGPDAVGEVLTAVEVHPLNEAKLSCVRFYLDTGVKAMTLTDGKLEVYCMSVAEDGLHLGDDRIQLGRLWSMSFDDDARGLLGDFLSEVSRRGKTQALVLRVGSRLLVKGIRLNPVQLRGELLYYTAACACAAASAFTVRHGHPTVTRGDMRDGIGYADAVAYYLGEADWESHLCEDN